jgi:RNA polymerase sigma-70 factor (ECF subfamily)
MQHTAIPPTVIELAQQGNRDAFDQVARASGDRCLAIACRILRDVDLAEDAVQTALVQAWRELRSLRDVDRFEPWLHRILVRACYAEAKRRRRWSSAIRTLPVDLASERNDILTVNDRDQLERAFRRLSVEHRSVLVLHHHVGLRLPEVAERLDINLGTAKSRLHYATSALRASLEADARTPLPNQERSA